MSRWTVFRHVVLWSALQKVRPAPSNQIVTVMLGTSAVSQIAAQDLTFVVNFVQLHNFRAFETYLVVTALYFALALLPHQLLAQTGWRFIAGHRAPAASAAPLAATATAVTSAGDAA